MDESVVNAWGLYTEGTHILIGVITKPTPPVGKLNGAYWEILVPMCALKTALAAVDTLEDRLRSLRETYEGPL